MSQSLVSVGIFLAVILCLPFAVKWFKSRVQGDVAQIGGQSRVVSAIAVGPQQKVVTIEVGPQGDRVWLTLGVTGQAITCLHMAPIQGDKSAEVVSAQAPLAPV